MTIFGASTRSAWPCGWSFRSTCSACRRARARRLRRRPPPRRAAHRRPLPGGPRAGRGPGDRRPCTNPHPHTATRRSVGLRYGRRRLKLSRRDRLGDGVLFRETFTTLHGGLFPIFFAGAGLSIGRIGSSPRCTRPCGASVSSTRRALRSETITSGAKSACHSKAGWQTLNRPGFEDCSSSPRSPNRSVLAAPGLASRPRVSSTAVCSLLAGPTYARCCGRVRATRCSTKWCPGCG